MDLEGRVVGEQAVAGECEKGLGATSGKLLIPGTVEGHGKVRQNHNLSAGDWLVNWGGRSIVSMSMKNNRMISSAWHISIALAFAAFVYFLALMLGKASELTAAATGFYASLVYFQLREMGQLRRLQEAQKEEEQAREHDRRAILRIGPFERRPPFFRRAPEVFQGQPIGVGYYVNIPLTNDGQTLARMCQPVLTACGRLSDHGWEREPNWVPVGLSWILDELNVRVAGKPTEERNLVPHRPYLFNLGKISARDPHVFRLLVIHEPTAQRADREPGEYCFEVTAFSENAEQDVKWYRVKWRGGFVSEETDGTLVLEVDELQQAPWAS
jgi:hypothetical protein